MAVCGTNQRSEWMREHLDGKGVTAPDVGETLARIWRRARSPREAPPRGHPVHDARTPDRHRTGRYGTHVQHGSPPRSSRLLVLAFSFLSFSPFSPTDEMRGLPGGRSIVHFLVGEGRWCASGQIGEPRMHAPERRIATSGPASRVSVIPAAPRFPSMPEQPLAMPDTAATSSPIPLAASRQLDLTMRPAP
jgi:hypothetical protein